MVLRLALLEPSEVAGLLHERYGVPVVSLDDVPEWLRGNVQTGGPPSDNLALNVDPGALDLGW